MEPEAGEIFRYIKLCKFCQKLYIAKVDRKNQKFCSVRCRNKSKWTPQEWSEYMRRHRRKILRKKKEEIWEKRIERMMNKGGYTRDDAIESLEAEDEM